MAHDGMTPCESLREVALNATSYPVTHLRTALLWSLQFVVYCSGFYLPAIFASIAITAVLP